VGLFGGLEAAPHRGSVDETEVGGGLRGDPADVDASARTTDFGSSGRTFVKSLISSV
jgi:hypothetical protein